MGDGRRRGWYLKGRLGGVSSELVVGNRIERWVHRSPRLWKIDVVIKYYGSAPKLWMRTCGILIVIVAYLDSLWLVTEAERKAVLEALEHSLYLCVISFCARERDEP
jgi:hypothetical protein